MKEPSALTLLHDGELCIVVVNGVERETRWGIKTRSFFFAAGDGFCPAAKVDEWWPASVKF